MTIRPRLRNRTPRRARSRRQPATGQWSPAYLNPYAWYDAHAGGSSTQITDSSANARAAMTVGGGSNSPLWLPYVAPAVYLPGAAGNYVSAPDAAALDITGDIDIALLVKPVAWAVFGALLGKYQSGSQHSYRFEINSSGGLTIYLSADGSAELSSPSSVAVPYSNGQACWVRATWRQSDGRVQFFTSPPDPTPTWTQLGANGSIAVASIFSGTSQIELGSLFGGSAAGPFNGGISRAVVRNGISGTIVADFDASLCGQTGYTGALGNVWTVNRATTGRKAVVQSLVANSAESLFLFGTDDWLDVPAAAIPPLDTFAAPSSVVAVFRRWHNPGAAGHPVFTTKANVGNTALGTAVRFATTAASASFVTAVGDGTNTDADAVGATLAFGTKGVLVSSVGNVSPFVSMSVNGGAANVDVSRTTTISTTTGLAGRVGAYTGGTGPIDMEFRAFLTFNRVLTGAEIAQLVAYYGGGL